MVPVNGSVQETGLIDAAVAWLSGTLPGSWTARRTERQVQMATPQGEPARIDTVIEVNGPNGGAVFAVEARSSFGPLDVERLLAGLTRTIRALGNVAVLVVAPWLSERTQEMLSEQGINFIDLTGNAVVRLDYPTLYIKTAGAARNPQPQPRELARVRGPKAARLIRLLVDVRPPYGVRELAAAAGLTPGYVSRLLEALDREALVDRSRKGEVQSTDVAGLLRRWATSYDVLSTNRPSRFIAPEGLAMALERLPELADAERVVITGSFAAVRRAPIAAPALLLLYSDDPLQVTEGLRLLPADAGANVVLLRPFDSVVFERTVKEDGLRYAAPSQVVVDCLTGTGRMPAEGEALLAWMLTNELQWRRSALSELGAATAG